MLSPGGIAATSTVVDKSYARACLIYAAMIMSKAPGVYLFLSVLGHGLHHESVAHDIESHATV